MDEPQNCCDKPCVQLLLLMEKHEVLRQDHEELKECKAKALEEVRAVLTEIRNDQLDIKLKIEKQTGFYAGVVALATGIVGIVGLAIAWVKP